MTLHQAIQGAAEKLTLSGIPNARLDAEVLLAFFLNRDRAWLFAHNRDLIDEGSLKLFNAAVDRRAQREPLQYILGRQEFWGLEFIVTPDVLIPRPETELLVETASALLKEKSEQSTLIDLCTGSGCIAISLAKEVQAMSIFAVDRSELALVIAGENARKHTVAERIRFLEGDLFSPLEQLDLYNRADVITANPPYIQTHDLPLLQQEVRDHEPEIALIAGPKGTEIHERIIEKAPEFLKSRGALIMEMGMGQAEKLAEMVRRTHAYGKPAVFRDLAGIDRVLVAKKI